jgi:hypothetical protein
MPSIERAGYDLGMGRVTGDMPGLYYDQVAARPRPCQVIEVFQDGDVTIELDGFRIQTKWRFVSPRTPTSAVNKPGFFTWLKLKEPMKEFGNQPWIVAWIDFEDSVYYITSARPITDEDIEQFGPILETPNG